MKKANESKYQIATQQLAVAMAKEGGASEQEVHDILKNIPKKERGYLIQCQAGKWINGLNGRHFVSRTKPAAIPTTEAKVDPTERIEQSYEFIRSLIAKHPNGINEHEFWLHVKNHIHREPTGYENQCIIGVARVYLKNGKYYPLNGRVKAVKTPEPPVIAPNPNSQVTGLQTIEVFADQLQTTQGGNVSAMMQFKEKVKLVIQIVSGKKE